MMQTHWVRKNNDRLIVHICVTQKGKKIQDIVAEPDVKITPGSNVTLCLVDEVYYGNMHYPWLRVYSEHGMPDSVSNMRKTWGEGKFQTMERGQTYTEYALGLWKIVSVSSHSLVLQYVGEKDDPPDAEDQLINILRSF